MRFEELPVARYIPWVYLESVLKQLENGNIFYCLPLGDVTNGMYVCVRLNAIEDKDESIMVPYWISNDTRRRLISVSKNYNYKVDDLFGKEERVRYLSEDSLEDIRDELMYSNIFTSEPIGHRSAGYEVHVRLINGGSTAKNGNETFYLISDSDRRRILDLKM